MSETATGIELNDDIAKVVNGALENGTPLIVAYVDADGKPHLSFRGSVTVHSKDQLGVWIRKSEGGLAGALSDNPNLTLMYRDPGTRVAYMFMGRGHVVDDEAVRKVVYETSPEREQQADPERKGVAVVIDLDTVSGGPRGAAVTMTRA